MANTIAPSPMTSFTGIGGPPPTLNLPIPGGVPWTAGAALVWVSGLARSVSGGNDNIISAVTGATPTAPVGISAQRIISTQSADNNLCSVTIALPNYLWEATMSSDVTPTQALLGGKSFIGKGNVAGSGGFCILNSTAAQSNPVATAVTFASTLMNVVGPAVFDKAVAITLANSSTITPSAATKGITGDTTPRAVFYWIPAACALLISNG